MRTLILSIAAVAALTSPALAQEEDVESEIVELTDTHESVIDAAGNMLLALSETMLADMMNLQPQDFITDDMVRSAMRGMGWNDLRSHSFAARQHVFDQYQCNVFEHFENPYGACNQMLNAESDEPNARYADRSSLPAELPMLSRLMRQQIFTVGRQYLKSPANLRATYDTHVDVAVDEFNQIFFADQQALRATLETMLTAIEESRNPLIVELLQTEQDAFRTLSYYLGNDRNSETRREAQAAYDLAEDERAAVVTDLRSLEFISRRAIEGGPDLVAMYEEIIIDFLGRITAE